MKQSQKALQLLETSEKLFYKYGIKKVTVEEICKTAGVSKMTFYKYYKNKEAIVEYIVDKLFDDGMKKFTHIFSQDILFEQKLEEWLEVKMKYSRSMSKEFYFDLLHFNQSTHDKIMIRTQQSQSVMIKQMEEAKAKGEIHINVNTEFFSYMLNHLMNFLDDPIFISMYSNLEPMTKDLLRFFLYGVVGRKHTNE